MKSSVKLFAMFIGLSMFALPTFTQDTPPVQPSELRSVVRLLPGYTSQAQDGVDTATEQISNKCLPAAKRTPNLRATKPI